MVLASSRQDVRVGWLLNAREDGPEYARLAAEVFESHDLIRADRDTFTAGIVAATGYASWDWNEGYFEPGEDPAPMHARAFGIRAIARELIENGFGHWNGTTGPGEAMADNGVYGSGKVANMKLFQEWSGLDKDGVCGPRTAKKLCQKRLREWESAEHGIELPDRLPCRQTDLETAFCFSCRNTYSFPEYGPGDLDPDGDHGLDQIHRPLDARFADGKYVCPKKDASGSDLTTAERWPFAYRVGNNIRVLCEVMRRNHKHIVSIAGTSPPEDIWRATVFAYNAPAWADQWILAGMPTSGGGTVTVGGWTGDKFVWANLYTNAVYSRSC